MSNTINGFFDEYRWLSNFWPCLVPASNGTVFRSVEAAYQATKLGPRHPSWALYAGLTAPEAKAQSKLDREQWRADWDAVKVDVMRRLLAIKFGPLNPNLASQLLYTGEQQLVEKNTWGDTFWGQFKGKGLNWLGVLLMQRRDQLRQETANGQSC